MAFRVPCLFLLMQLMPDAHRSKPLTTRHRLCLCSDRALRIQFTNDKESSFVSCDQRCADENNKGISWTGSRFRLRTRRELSEEQQACYYKTHSDPRWIINNLNVTFHDRENSSSWYFRVSWNPFTDSSQRWKGYCLSYSAPGSVVVDSSYVSKNLTSVNISATPGWGERTVFLTVFVLPMFANYSQNEVGLLLNPYRRRRPDPTLGPGISWTGSRFRVRTRRELRKEQQACYYKTQSDPRWIINNLNVTFHDRENSSSWYFRVSWNPFTDSSQRWKGYCLSYSAPGSVVVDSSYVSKNLTSVNISATPGWGERTVFLTVFVLPMFANYSQNEVGLLLNPYRRRRPDPTLGPGISWTGSRFRVRTRRELRKEQQACNDKTHSDPRWIIDDLNVTFHDRENSSSWYFRVSWNPFTDSSQRWKGYCLSYSAPGSFFVNSSYVSKNLTSVNISATPGWEERTVFLRVFVLPMFANYSQNEVSIFFNPYRRRRPGPTLDPGVIPPFTSKFPTEKGVIPPLTSKFPTEKGVIPPLTSKFPTEKESSNTTTYVSISLGIVVGLALVFGFLVYFFCPTKPDFPLPSDFDYHAFIIYSNEDRLWLKNKLLPFLEEKHHLTCCVHYRDFVLGKPFRDNMAHCVNKSYKVIALFSTYSVESNYFHYELDLAIGRLVEKRDRSLVVIRIDNVDSGLLPEELRKRSFVDYYDIQQRPFWKQRLIKFFDLPEVSRTNSTTADQNCDNSIDRDYPVHENENKTKVRFNRLESTTSNDSVISYL